MWLGRRRRPTTVVLAFDRILIENEQHAVTGVSNGTGFIDRRSEMNAYDIYYAPKPGDRAGPGHANGGNTSERQGEKREEALVRAFRVVNHFQSRL